MIQRPPDRARRWRVVAGAASLILLLAGIALVPPGTLPYPPHSTYSDAQVSHWPNAFVLRQAVLAGHQWPFWNPLRMLGQPFAANPLTKVYYPPQWLVFLIPPTAHLDLLIYLHLAWLGAGMVTWMRGERRRMLTAFVMALAWGLNPKVIGHLGAGHLDILYALSWTPWLMWAARRLVTQPAIRNGILAGVVVALLGLADPRMAAYFTPLAVLYGLSLIPRDSRAARLVVPGAAAVVVLLLLSAEQVLPLLSIGPYLTRASISPLDAAEFSLPPHYLVGLILPDLGGEHEWMTALGLPVILLAIYSLRTAAGRRRALLWWAVAIVAGLWALGSFGPLYLPAVRLIPALTWLRIPSRAWFLVDFSAVALAGIGLEALLETGPGRWGRLAAVALIAAGLSSLVAVALIPKLPGAIAWLGGSLLGTGAGLALAGPLRGEARSGPWSQSVWAGPFVLVATLAISLFGLDATLVIPHSVTDIEQPEQAIIARLDPGCKSVYSPTFELIGPATVEAGVVTLHGVDPFELLGSARYIATAAGVSLHGYSVIAPPMPPGETDLSRVRPRLNLLQLAGVCDVVSSFPLDVSGLDATAHSGTETIYHIPALFGAPGFITWKPFVYGFAPATVQACVPQDEASPAVIVPQSWAPGWRAWVDGQPAAVDSYQDDAMLSIPLGSGGCHQVALAYQPLPDLLGAIVSGLTGLALVIGWAVTRFRTGHA